MRQHTKAKLASLRKTGLRIINAEELAQVGGAGDAVRRPSSACTVTRIETIESDGLRENTGSGDTIFL